MKRNNLQKSVCRTMHRRPAAGMFRTALSGVVLMLAASCSDGMDGDSSDRLPDGRYPMTFTAAVDGLTATRVAKDGNGKTSWQANDLVAISMDGGSSNKVYKITDAGTGAMSPNNSGGSDANTLYWSKTQENIAAWYPVTCTIGSGTSTGEVSITDQSSDFEALENILHAPATQYSYSNGSGSNGSVAFTFRHALAKVKVTLKKEDGKSDFTDDEISNATVAFMGYTAGSLGYNGLTVPSSSTNGAIKPKTETPSGGSGTSPTTYTALLIPQQMQGKPFIKVTIGANDYYYEPQNSTDANLEAGKAYSYTITVKKEGLTVQVNTADITWGDSGTESSSQGDSNINFQVKIPDTGTNPSITVGNDATKQQDGTYKVPLGKSFTITYTFTDFSSIKGFPVVGGSCKVERTCSTTNGQQQYVFTYSDIRSDLQLEYGLYGEPGDFYCKDASNNAYIIPKDVSSLTDDQKSACQGIVFWKGNPNKAYGGERLRKDHPGCVHGLVVAKGNATATNDGKMKWMESNYSVLNWISRSFYIPDIYDYEEGYAMTSLLNQFNQSSVVTSNNNYKVLPAAELTTFQTSNSAPSGSSGWYWPTIAELKILCWGQGAQSAGTAGREMIDTQLSAAGGTGLSTDTYWSSKDGNDNSAYALYFNNGTGDNNTLSKSEQYKVRYILAF
ncbi:fimbrillin family protein [Phocaeicola sp.]